MSGRVIDESSGRGIPFAQVDLEDAGSALTTDSTGAFRFPPMAPGAYTLRVRAIGFVPRRVVVRLAPASALDLVIRLVPVAVALPELVTTEARRARRLELAGFYERATLKLGQRMLDRAMISASGVTRMSELFRHLGGLYVDCPPGRACQVGTSRQRSCRILLNGAPDVLGLALGDVLPPGALLGAEVYTRTPPAEFGAAQSGCVILLWTGEAD